MAVDLKTEVVIDALREVPNYLGKGRNGKPVHRSFVLRAITKGIHGHRLEALRCGSRWISSVEAVQRWTEAQTADAISSPPTAISHPSKRSESASRELDQLGL